MIFGKKFNFFYRFCFSRGINSLNNRASKNSDGKGKLIADRIQFAFPHTDFGINWTPYFEQVIFNSLLEGTLLKFETKSFKSSDHTAFSALPVYIVMFENSWLLLCIKEECFKDNFSAIDMKTDDFLLFDICTLHSVREYKDSHAKIVKIPTTLSVLGRDGSAYSVKNNSSPETLPEVWFNFGISFTSFKDSAEYQIRINFARTDDYFTYELTDDFLQDAAHHGDGKFDNIKVNPKEISDSDILI